MTRSKSHHVVPRFYLRRFTDKNERLWVLDKADWRSYSASLDHVACVKYFYAVGSLQEIGLDTCFLEQQFSHVEGMCAPLVDRWLRELEQNGRAEVSRVDREVFSQFIVLQMLRTVEARMLLLQFLRRITEGAETAPRVPTSDSGINELHASLLWEEELVDAMAARILRRVWIFGHNQSSKTFLTSDHPVLIKDEQNRGWVQNPFVREYFLKESMCEGDYVVFPLSPRWVLYCHGGPRFQELTHLDCQKSPVMFTPDMVDHENSGQVGMSHRFVYSIDGDYSFAKRYATDQPWIRDPNRDRFASRPNPYKPSEEGDTASAQP